MGIYKYHNKTLWAKSHKLYLIHLKDMANNAVEYIHEHQFTLTPDRL